MERNLRNFVITRAAAGVTAALLLVGVDMWQDDSRLPREIASYSDGEYSYKMSAACGLFDTKAIHDPAKGEQVLRLQGENQTVVAYSDNLMVNGGLYYERFYISGLTEKLGYHRYRATFGDIEIKGGIFCPPRF